MCVTLIHFRDTRRLYGRLMCATLIDRGNLEAWSRIQATPSKTEGGFSDSGVETLNPAPATHIRRPTRRPPNFGSRPSWCGGE